VLEAKNTTTMARKDFEEGIDPSYICQTQHYLLVTGWQKAYLALEIDGNNFDCVEFGVISEVQDAIKYFSSKFWQSVEKARSIKEEYNIGSYYGVNPILLSPKQQEGVFLLQQLEPDLTGQACEVEFLRKYIKPTKEYTEIDGDENLLELARQYHAANENAKIAQQNKDKVYNEIITTLGGIHCAKFEVGNISYKEDSAGRKKLYVSPKLLTI
jgi:hypothetical protein